LLLKWLGERIVAQPDKDGFNFDDFQYSGVKLSPVPDLSEAGPTPDPLAAQPVDLAASAPVAPIVDPLAVEPADKKSKKKAKKEKPAKVKKTVVAVAAPAGEKRPSALIEKLSRANPLNVLLGVALAALLLAVIIMFIEWSSYDRDINAAKAKSLTTMNKTFSEPFADSMMAKMRKSRNTLY
jgi:hypothetical protein